MPTPADSISGTVLGADCSATVIAEWNETDCAERSPKGARAECIKSAIVEGRDPWYYATLLDYIHLNPVRAGLVKVTQGESVREYPWSSVASGYAIARKARAPWLAVADGLAAFDCEDTAAGRREFVERLDQRAREEKRRDCGIAEGPEDGRMSNLRHGWYWGKQAFGEKMAAVAEGVIKLGETETIGAHRSINGTTSGKRNASSGKAWFGGTSRKQTLKGYLVRIEESWRLQPRFGQIRPCR